MQLNFKTSNNEVEYEMLLASLHRAKYVGPIKFIIHLDSQFAACQLEGMYEVKNERLNRYTKA